MKSELMIFLTAWVPMSSHALCVRPEQTLWVAMLSDEIRIHKHNVKDLYGGET